MRPTDGCRQSTRRSGEVAEQRPGREGVSMGAVVVVERRSWYEPSPGTLYVATSWQRQVWVVRSGSGRVARFDHGRDGLAGNGQTGSRRTASRVQKAALSNSSCWRTV